MVNTELVRAIIQDPLVVSPSLSVAEAIARMCSAQSETPLAPKTAYKQFSQIGAHASCLLVMNDNQLLGVLTNWDIVRLSANGHCFDRTLLSEVMSQPVITLKQSEITDIFVALQLLQQHDIRHLPVVNEQDALIGLLTLNSLYQALYPANFLRLRTTAEVMTPQVICATPKASVLEIARLMTAHRVSSVVIVEPSLESGVDSSMDSLVLAIATSSQECQQSSPPLQAVGIITAGDLVQFQAAHGDFKQTQARRIMSSPLVVHPHDSLWIAQQQMQHKQVSQAIVEGDRRELLGIVTPSTWLQIMNPVELYKLVESLEQKNWHLEAQQTKSLELDNLKLTQELQQKTAQLQKQLEREQLLISITTHIHSSLELQNILNSVVIEIQSFLQCDRVLVYQFHPDWSGTVTAESVRSEWQSSLGNTITDSCFQDKIDQLYIRGIKHSVSDIYQAGYPDCYFNLLERYQVKANLVVPILLEQQVWGLLIGHQCTAPRLWESTDLDLLDKIAAQLAIAIQRLHAYEQATKEIIERQQIELVLKQSKATENAIFQGIPDLLIRIHRNGNRREFISGDSVQVINLPADSGRPKVCSILPENLAAQRLYYTALALETGQMQIYEHQIEIEGQWYDEEIRITPLNQDEVVVVVRDITVRKQAEKSFQNLVEGTAAIAGEDFFAKLTQYIASTLKVSNVVIARRQGNQLVSCSFWANQQMQPNIAFPYENTPCALTMQLGIYKCFSQIQQLFPNHPILEKFEAKAYIGIALTDAKGVSVGTLCIFNDKPFIYEHLLVDMLRVFAVRISAELERQSAIDALKKLNGELEDRIKQRTAELSEFKYALDEATIASITNAEGVITYVNDRYCEISQYSRAELTGKTHQLINSGHHSKQFFAHLWKTISSGKTWRGEICNRSKNGTYYWIDKTIVPFVNNQGKPIQYLAISTDITARKQAEFDARSLKERLQFLLSSSPAVIYTCRVSGHYEATSISENVTALLGYEPAEFLQDSQFWLKHIHPSDRTRVCSEISTLSTQERLCHEYRFLHQDGYYCWMRDEQRLIYDSNGNPTEIIGYFANITDLKQAELDLQGLTLSLQNAMEGISQLDKQGRYLTLNRAYANALGYEPDELIGVEWQNTIHPDDIPLLKKVYQTMLQQGKAETEARGLRKDGSVFYKQITMVALLDQEEQFNGHYCFLKDISDRKTTEEALKRHHTAIEAAIDGIAILEGDCYTYLNKSHLEMFGYEQAEDLLNKSWKNLYAPEEVSRIEQEVFPVLLRQRFWQGEAIATRKDGSTFIEGLSLTITENGALICVCRDITEQKQAEVKIQQANEQLLLANAELARATRLKDEFLANMSHELRTPLNAILGISEGLQERAFGEINDNQERAIATIDRSGRHLLELINDILDLAKIESGKLDLQITSVPIKYLCESSLIFIRQMAVKKNIQLTADIPTTIPDFLVDERRMRQVLINLLNNAVKFTPDGGAVRLVVRQESQAGNNFILFEVYDTGIGIAPDEISQLFQPFVQIDSSLTRQYQGTGLGLSLVRQLVQLHGGAVTVTSEVNHGSCFSVKIPYTECLGDPTSATPAIELLSNFSNKTILVVEDTPSAAEQTTRYLAEGGLNTVIHSTGQGVLEAAIEKQPALIILDLLLPDVSGWDILTQLKAHPQTQTIPVIITSVMDERSRAIALGASEYLVKPINRHQLRSVLNSPRLSFASLPEIPKARVSSMIAPPCILLAEDNAASVATLSGYLKNRGFQLIVAKDGEEAIALTETHYPNVILMDVQMPKIDGLSAIRQIRANSATADIPIIALTALAMSGDREKCIDAGANEYMTKPVRLKSLVELIQRLLRK